MRTAPARTPLLPLLRPPSPPCHPLPFSLLAPCGHELRAPDRAKLIHRVEIRTSSSRMLTLMTAATSHTMKCAYHTLQPSFFLEFSFPPPDRKNDRLRLYLSDWTKREHTDSEHATLPCCVAVCVYGGGGGGGYLPVGSICSASRRTSLSQCSGRNRCEYLISILIAETERRNRHVFKVSCVQTELCFAKAS